MGNEFELSAAAGFYLRSIREEHGLTLDEVRRAARIFGAKWSISRVQAIENGQAAPSLETFLTIALVASKLTGTPVRLEDLFASLEYLQLNADSPLVPSSFLLGALAGQPIETDHWDRIVASSVKGTKEHRVQWGLSDEPTLAETRAAAKLGIPVEEVWNYALKLWQVPLDQESKRRAGDNASPQARGRVTRLLVEEIRQEIDEGS